MLATQSPASDATAPARWARLRRLLWLLPLLASLLFVAGVLTWAYRADRQEREDRRATMIADALSSEAQLRGLLDVEIAHLKELARQLPRHAHSASGLLAGQDVREGLRRLWLSVTWLDANNRILAHVPEKSAPSGMLPGDALDGSGLSAHLTQAVGNEKLVLRYSPAISSLRPLNSIALDGGIADKVMFLFKKVLSEGQAEAIYHYVVSQANKAKAIEQAARKP